MFPWHIRIFVNRKQHSQYICGGSLITALFVLSAAHCVANLNLESIRLTVGASSTNEFSVQRIIVHPLYLGKAGNYGSDICLLQLHHAVAFNINVHPVCIDWQLDDITSNMQSTIGYVVAVSASNIVKLPVVDYDQCLNEQRKDFWKFISFTTFCAGETFRMTGVGNGDSGSGLVFWDVRTGKWYVKVSSIEIDPIAIIYLIWTICLIGYSKPEPSKAE